MDVRKVDTDMPDVICVVAANLLKERGYLLRGAHVATTFHIQSDVLLSVKINGVLDVLWLRSVDYVYRISFSTAWSLRIRQATVIVPVIECVDDRIVLVEVK
jgi:hypothetical protein